HRGGRRGLPGVARLRGRPGTDPRRAAGRGAAGPAPHPRPAAAAQGRADPPRRRRRGPPAERDRRAARADRRGARRRQRTGRRQPAAERLLHADAGEAPPASAIVALRPSPGAAPAAANGRGSGGFNTATAGQYAPGSTFKVVTALALLRAGLTPGDVVTRADP